MIVFLQFPGLRNLQKPDSFFAILVARQDRTSEAPSSRCGTVLKVFASSQMPTSASVRPRCLCLCVNQTVVARFGATTCPCGGIGLQATGLHSHQVSPTYPLSFRLNISKVCNNLYFPFSTKPDSRVRILLRHQI